MYKGMWGIGLVQMGRGGLLRRKNLGIERERLSRRGVRSTREQLPMRASHQQQHQNEGVCFCFVGLSVDSLGLGSLPFRLYVS